MKFAIVGASGATGKEIARQAVKGGHEVVSVVRAAGRAPAGTTEFLHDFNNNDGSALKSAFASSDVVIFAAGAGWGSDDIERVDLEGTKATVEAAISASVHRYVQISAIGAEGDIPEGFGTAWGRRYYGVKLQADRVVQESGLDWTILRPGGLTSGAATGKIELGVNVAFGSISRRDLAAVVLEVARNASSSGRAWEVVNGGRPIAEAVQTEGAL